MGDSDQASSGKTERKESFAQCDYLKFRRAFDKVAGKGKSMVAGCDLAKVAAKLGYDISQQQLKASRHLDCSPPFGLCLGGEFLTTCQIELIIGWGFLALLELCRILLESSVARFVK